MNRLITNAKIHHDIEGHSAPFMITLDFTDIAKQIRGGRANKDDISEIEILLPKGCHLYGIPVKWGTQL